MKPYLDLLRDVRQRGRRKPTRGVLASTGQHIDALSIFGAMVRYDLAETFPAVTTKRIPFGQIEEELGWFLRGETNVRSLQAAGVKFWDEWADENGDLGPVYGAQWRSWPCPDGRIIDQIDNVVRDIREVIANPTASPGRRLIVTAWNPADVGKVKLPPCHCFFQFSVTDGALSCLLYQRSGDMFLGVPFNIASYALLTHLIAHITGLKVGEFVHAFGDAHIYENHLAQVDEQLARDPLPAPRLVIRPEFTSLRDFRREDAWLVDYAPHPPIKAEVAI